MDGFPLLFQSMEVNFDYLFSCFPDCYVHGIDYTTRIFDINALHHFAFNLSTAEDPKIIEIGSDFKLELKRISKNMSKGIQKSSPTWSYANMPGINKTIAEHFIPTDPNIKPVK
ncbi:hypothetical protein JCGZ_19762 [Jatropha curcas]|uniref:Uncharacterized protein n=1 Tax=Jatropha curcas TaxID=180498 RepID=A0A067LIZ7_JATCU|nr:hypothetical protein JCGZ_19762 [Jatropha curcas]